MEEAKEDLVAARQEYVMTCGEELARWLRERCLTIEADGDQTRVVMAESGGMSKEWWVL